MITLIIPPSPFLLDERVFMALGILRVAASLEQAGYEVDVLDLSGAPDYTNRVRHYAENTESRFFGITATSPQYPHAVQIRDCIRQICPRAKIILGGPHVTLVCAAYKRNPVGRAEKSFQQLSGFDAWVSGDGEKAIHDALSQQGWIDADDPKSSRFLSDPGEMPHAARHLVDVESYHYQIDGYPSLSLIAQLGCPFACGFCGGRHSPSYRRIRQRSNKRVIDEMRHLYTQYGTRGFMFYDDELNVSRGMDLLMKDIVSLQGELGVDFRLRGFIKAQLFNETQALWMREAGFRWILVGFESGSPRILRNIIKQSTREENSRCMQIAKEAGLKVKALMSIGHPGESSETLQETADWLMCEAPDDFDLTIITPYPGSPYYDDAILEEDRWIYRIHDDNLYQIPLDYEVESNYYKGIPGHYTSYVYTDDLGAEDLVAARDGIEHDIRMKLGLVYPQAKKPYEHSMGQT